MFDFHFSSDIPNAINTLQSPLSTLQVHARRHLVPYNQLQNTNDEKIGSNISLLLLRIQFGVNICQRNQANLFPINRNHVTRNQMGNGKYFK